MEEKESLKRLFDQLNDEQKEKFRNCRDVDEIKKLADDENFELSEEQIDFLGSAGSDCCPRECYYYECTSYEWHPS